MEFVAFLEQFVRASPRRNIVVILESVSIYKARVVAACLLQDPQVGLPWLPAYSGHDHNPLEKV